LPLFYYRKSLRRVWKLFSILIGFVLPTSQKLYDSLEKFIAISYIKNAEPKTRKNIRYAYNRLIHSYARGERKYIPTLEEFKYLQVFLLCDKANIEI